MDQEYDFIVLGTGLKECILSGLLSVNKNSVLHMDRNNYYGGESASLNLEQLYEKFEPESKAPESLGRARDYNVDLCPKMIMTCGNLVKTLVHTKVTRYLDFRLVKGSYVYQDQKIHKVPSTPVEAMSSTLLGFFQKRYYKSFLEFVSKFEANDPKSMESIAKVFTPRELYAQYGLDDQSIAFTGHAIALYLDDSYLDVGKGDNSKKSIIELIERIKLYVYSLSRYQGAGSPYIYPVWGLGGLPEGFSRLCAIHGGVYMLNKPIEEIIYDEQGKVTGVKSGGEIARCKKLLADPTYFLNTDKVKKAGQVAKSICILKHPVVNEKDVVDSCQIIFPASQLNKDNKTNRKSDIYLSSVSYQHKVASEGRWIAVVSADVETKDAKGELAPVLKLLEPIEKEFFFVSDLYEPTGDGSKDNVFISSSYDATSHFETATDDVLSLYERLTGKPVDLTIAPDLEASDDG